MKNVDLNFRCSSIPQLERINYFYGQMLGVRELAAEQRYFREKLKLHNRYLHGWGVVCGLEVKPCPRWRDPCAPEPRSEEEHGKRHEDRRPDACIEVDCGLAIDCEGNEIVVRAPAQIHLWKSLDDEGRKAVAGGGANGVWLKICFHEQPIEPVRPVVLDTCGTSLPDCVHARVRDGYCLKVVPRWEHAPEDECSCGPCDHECRHRCLTLAWIEKLHPDRPVLPGHVHTEVRRPLAPFETTRIVGVNWAHGGEYGVDDAYRLLRDGIELRFSSGVRVDTMQRGVIDVWGIEGPGGRAGQIFHIDGVLEPRDVRGELARAIRFRQVSKERLQSQDRVLIIFRADFVLDRCCRPVDGNHVGGMVPAIDDKGRLVGGKAPCVRPGPEGGRPWTSGNGTPGGTFESWFYIKLEHREGEHEPEREQRVAR